MAKTGEEKAVSKAKKQFNSKKSSDTKTKKNVQKAQKSPKKKGSF